MAWYTRAQVRANPLSYSNAEADALLARVTARASRVTQEYIDLMGQHIQDIGKLKATDVHRLQQFKRMSMNMDKVRRDLARAGNISVEELEEMFERAAIVDSRMAADILGFHGALDISQNLAYKRIIQEQAQETAAAIRNLSNTTVVNKYYRSVVDEACFAVQNGLADYNTAIRKVVRQAGYAGLRVVDSSKVVEYESGYSRRLDSAARMNVLDGTRHLNQSILEEVGRDFGADGVEISAHMLCAPDHAPYQGRQFTNADFEDIQSSLARPFGEWNCRHNWWPVMLGISQPSHTSEELQRYLDYSVDDVEIDGASKTRYEWSQEMRRCEASIRQSKDCANLAAKSGDMTLRRQCQTRIDRLEDHYDLIASRTKLEPEYNRMTVSGFHRVKAG